MPGRNRTYGLFALLLHWISAASILVTLPLGWWMMRLIRSPETLAKGFPLVQLHKSIGFTILALTVARIAWRAAHRTPPFPSGMPPWEQRAALAGQALFYLLLVAVPLSGWIYISTRWAEVLDRPFKAGSYFFGLFEIPYIGAIANAPERIQRFLSFHVSAVHAWLAYALAVLIFLHAAAALKHHFVDRNSVLSRMLPFLSGEEEDAARPIALGRFRVWLAAFAIVSIAGLAGWISRPVP